jgi:PP-loop superfamily ATP-utilizing enzyme
MDGTNADDLHDYRQGITALKELDMDLEGYRMGSMNLELSGKNN